MGELGGAGRDLGRQSSTASAPATSSSSPTARPAGRPARLLRPPAPYHGLGIGGHALTAAMRRGFELGPKVLRSRPTPSTAPTRSPTTRRAACGSCAACSSGGSDRGTSRFREMAYDEALAERIRDLLALREASASARCSAASPGCCDGNMACGVIGERADRPTRPEDGERALAEPHTRRVRLHRPADEAVICVEPAGIAERRGARRLGRRRRRLRRLAAAEMNLDRWWRDAVVYQVYPRSFQDSDGDGIGDLRGIARASTTSLRSAPTRSGSRRSTRRRSPTAATTSATTTRSRPRYGTLADFDALVAAAHERGLRVLMDLVASHTSIEHPWFREHPDCYVWADGERRANNWRSAFGGPAWSRDERSGRWYLHSFYPEQPDLDWRNPEVREAMGEVVRFWRRARRRRLSPRRRRPADEGRPSCATTRPPSGRSPLPLHAEHADARARPLAATIPTSRSALAALRAAAGDALLVGEVYLPKPSSGLGAAVPRAPRPGVRASSSCTRRGTREPPAGGDRRRAAGPGIAWVLSNHDFPRLPTRVGAAARAAPRRSCC